MDTILPRIILESMVCSGSLKWAEQGRSGNPFKRNKRDCSVDESSPNVVLGSTTWKESTSERTWDGYMDLAGSSLWDSSATLSAQLQGSSVLFCRNWNGHLQNFSWSFWNNKKILFSFTFHRLAKNKSFFFSWRKTKVVSWPKGRGVIHWTISSVFCV